MNSTNKDSLSRSQMNIVIAGHVDHGKSTVIGRLLADTNSLPDGKLDFVKQQCEINARPFEYAFLLDALKDEQAQGITIDSARVFFSTEIRDYIIIDAPGHIEFLKNMVSGAARAEAALLVIDANEGVQENSRRHGYMLSMLGIKQIAVVINKMDLVEYSESVFNKIKKEYAEFLSSIGVKAKTFIPVSGREGDGIAQLTESISWYSGQTVLDVLDDFEKEKPAINKPFRMPVQAIYKFTNMGDDRRVVAGTIETGTLSKGDTVVFYPSGKKSKVKSVERFNAPKNDNVSVNEAASFTLDEQIYITRGEMAAKDGELAPKSSKKIKVSLFWLGRKPFEMNKEYFLKIGTAKVSVKLEEIQRVINASNLDASEEQRQISRHEVAECTLKLDKAIAFDLAENNDKTSRFVIVDEYEIAGGGIIQKVLEDKYSQIRDNVILRNYKWAKSIISPEKRAEKYSQKSTLIIVTGPTGAGKKEVAKILESQLFTDGRIVYFLGIGNVKYGIDADLENSESSREEHLRRLAEVAHIMLDAGALLIVTARDLTQDDLEIVKTIVNPDKITTVWTGDDFTSDLSFDIKVPGLLDVEESSQIIKNELYENGLIFKPW
ncbi:MAG: GTP-binding protein [Melioribacteraceae bacterium]|jgi:bifunctional enzyme CysN/CysC|nr:GTP-binding protein [Melioribacteraceae bacterium]